MSGMSPRAVAHEMGYKSTKAFNKLFHSRVGSLPNEWIIANVAQPASKKQVEERPAPKQLAEESDATVRSGETSEWGSPTGKKVRIETRVIPPVRRSRAPSGRPNK